MGNATDHVHVHMYSHGQLVCVDITLWINSVWLYLSMSTNKWSICCGVVTAKLQGGARVEGLFV